ncbi:40S ribosomal protein S5-1 [Hordeum vulgare]|nr:40S ribosomal protein S5-1 [Hordeum vulgare]
MREGVLHIRDVEGAKKTGSMKARLEAMEQQVFKCQEMVERGLNTNHMMIMELTNKQKIDVNDIGKHLSRLYDRIDHLQAQIYDLENQNSVHPELLPLEDHTRGVLGMVPAPRTSPAALAPGNGLSMCVPPHQGLGGCSPCATHMSEPA